MNTASQDTDALFRRIAWRLVPLILAMYIAAFLNRVNVGFAALTMNKDLGFSPEVYGWGTGIFFLGYLVFEVPSNLIMERVGARLWLSRIMITWALVSMTFAFVQGPVSFFALRFLLGLAEAGFYPGVILYLTYWFPAHYRGRVIAVLMSAIPISSIVGNPISGWIMDAMNHTAGMPGWKWMFVLEALPAVLVGIACLFYLDNSIAAAKWLNDDEKRVLTSAIAHDTKTQVAGTHNSLAAFKDPRVWMMSLIYFFFVMGQYGMTFWMPTLIKTAGVVGNTRIGIVSAIPFIVTLILMNVLGRSADHHRERRWHLVIPALIGAVGFVIVPNAPNVTLAVCALSLAAAGAITCAPLMWALPTSFLAGAGAAAGIAVINSFGNLSGFAAPYLIGYVKDATGSAAIGLYIIAGGLVAGAILVLMTPAKLVNR